MASNHPQFMDPFAYPGLADHTNRGLEPTEERDCFSLAGSPGRETFTLRACISASCDARPVSVGSNPTKIWSANPGYAESVW